MALRFFHLHKSYECQLLDEGTPVWPWDVGFLTVVVVLLLFLLIVFQQKCMNLMHLTLVQSEDFMSLKISILRCNVARAFSCV